MFLCCSYTIIFWHKIDTPKCFHCPAFEMYSCRDGKKLQRRTRTEFSRPIKHIPKALHKAHLHSQCISPAAVEFSKSFAPRNLYSKFLSSLISYSAYLNFPSSFIISYTAPLQPFSDSPPQFSILIFCFTNWDGRFYFAAIFLLPHALLELGHSLLKSWGLLPLPLNLGRIL